MSRTLILSDGLYASLAERTRRRGVTIEELLRMWPDEVHVDEPAVDGTHGDTQARRAAVRSSSAIYEQLAARYGTFPNSTTLLRGDRER